MKFNYWKLLAVFVGAVGILFATVLVTAHITSRASKAVIVTPSPSSTFLPPINNSIRRPFTNCEKTSLYARRGWTVYGWLGSQRKTWEWSPSLNFAADIANETGEDQIEVTFSWYCPPR